MLGCSQGVGSEARRCWLRLGGGGGGGAPQVISDVQEGGAAGEDETS